MFCLNKSEELIISLLQKMISKFNIGQCSAY